MGEARHQAAAAVFGRLEETEQRQLLVLLRVAAESGGDPCERTERGKRGA